MLKYNILLCTITIISLTFSCQETTNPDEKQNINEFINNWHLAASNADTSYFSYLDENAIYIGTDATERWTKKEFLEFALPHFKKGKAWDFKTIERKIYFPDVANLAWFDETLNTWMGVCRSSGVVCKLKDGSWKIKHYHLSCTVPNEKIKQFVDLINQETEKEANKE